MIKEYLYTNFSLNERTALVTGSARGIGLAISTALGRAGAQVIIDDLNESACIESVDKLKAEGIRASSNVAGPSHPMPSPLSKTMGYPDSAGCRSLHHEFSFHRTPRETRLWS